MAKRIRIGRRRMTCEELTKSQRYSLLVVGDLSHHVWPGGDEPTRAELRREAWRTHKAELLAAWMIAEPGTRPLAWWQFDAPVPMAGTFANEQAFLIHHRLLTATERRALKALKAAGEPLPCGRYTIRIADLPRRPWPADLRL